MTGSLSGISFGGLASGLDTGAIIRQLMAIERRPVLKMEQQKGELLRTRGLLSELENRLGALRDAASDLRRDGSFLAYQAAVDREGFLTATAGPGASAGSYSVAVLSLARSRSAASLGKADKDVTTYGSGTLRITVGGEAKDVAIGSGNNTLQGIADAINGAGAGVTASVLKTGEGEDPYRLVIASNRTGTANAFTLEALDADGGGLSGLADEIEANETVAAADARLRMNGLEFTRSSNVVGDVVPGVTLSLIGVHPDQDPGSMVTVSTDASAVADKVEKLVEAYNKVVSFIRDQNALDGEGRAKGPLFGDSGLRSILSGLQRVAGSAVETGSASRELLAQVGITGSRDGTLSFDRAAFEEALGEDEEHTRLLFTLEETGIAQALYSRSSDYTRSVDGILAARKGGLDERQRSLEASIRRMEDRLQAVEARLVARFTAMEQMIARIQAQGSSLGILG